MYPHRENACLLRRLRRFLMSQFAACFGLGCVSSSKLFRFILVFEMTRLQTDPVTHRALVSLVCLRAGLVFATLLFVFAHGFVTQF